MPWLLLLLAAVAFAFAFISTSMTIGILCLLAALGLMLGGMMQLLAQRIGSRSRDETAMIDPAELHRLRAQLEARRNAAEAATHQHQQTPPPAP